MISTIKSFNIATTLKANTAITLENHLILPFSIIFKDVGLVFNLLVSYSSIIISTRCTKWCRVYRFCNLLNYNHHFHVFAFVVAFIYISLTIVMLFNVKPLTHNRQSDIEICHSDRYFIDILLLLIQQTDTYILKMIFI